MVRAEHRRQIGLNVKKTRGFSLIELLIVVAIILIIAAIAIPNLLRSRMSAHESSAVSTLRNIHSSQATYLVQYGPFGFADTLTKLGPGAPCDETHACMLDEFLGCSADPCTKSGYNFYLLSGAATLPRYDYTSTASPTAFGSSGRQNYCTVEDGVIRGQVTPAGPVASLAHAACADPTNFVSIR